MKHWQEQRSKRQALLERELERIVQVLRQVGAQRIILFGSAAREDIAAWSDLDLIVVLHSDLPFIKRLGLLYERIEPRVGLDLLYPSGVRRDPRAAVHTTGPARREGAL